LQAIKENNLKPEQIDEIVMKGNKLAEDLFTPAEIKINPTTSITAKTAIPFIIGVALKHRSVAIAHFLPENLKDPEVLETARKVKFQLDPELGSFSSRVEIKTKDGKTCQSAVDILRGSTGNPMSTNELIEKFKDCARYAKKPISESAVNKLVDSILNLEQINDIGEITKILE
jgi:2-methylcitrate dehydratase PrpD